MTKKILKGHLKDINTKIDKLILANKSYKALAIQHKNIIKALAHF